MACSPTPDVVLTGMSTSDLSLNARALSSDEALVTWSFIGDVDVSSLRLFIANSPVVKWHAFQPGRRHTEFRLQGLEPRPRPPTGVSVKKMTDGKVKVGWSSSGQSGIIGYLLFYSEVDASDQPVGEVKTEPVFGTSRSFVIEDLKPDSRYRFRVSALSRYGEGVHSSPVFVGEKVTKDSKIVIPPKHQKVTQGGTAIFLCKAIANPMPNIVWRKSGKKLTSKMNDISIVNKDGLSMLKVTDVSSKRNGPYVCIAGNTVGKRAKAKGVLTVLKRRAPTGYPAISTSKQSSTDYVGSNVTLECKVKGKAPLNIVWYRNSYPIRPAANKRLSVTADGRLSIRDIQKSDEATYECSAENKLGFMLSAKQLLHINEKPRIPNTSNLTKTEETIEVPHGSSVRLQCIPVDQHAGTLTWLRNNQHVNGDDNNQQVYTISDVNVDFTVTCVVGYKTYNATKTFYIVVKKKADSGKPIMTRGESSKSITMGMNTTPPTPTGPDHVTITGLETPKRLGEYATLTCVSSPSHPAAVISWFVRGRKLTDAVATVEEAPDGGYVTTSRLDIKVTDKDGNVTYKCRANNKHLGKTVSSSVMLRIYGSSKRSIISIPPSITRASRLNNTSAIVEWRPPTDMLRYIKRFKIYYTPVFNNSSRRNVKAFTEMLDKDIWRHKTSSLVPDVGYRVEVALVTSDGEGPRSVPSRIQSAVPKKLVAFTSALESVAVKEHGTAVFTCTATGQPLFSLHWQHNDTAVNFDDLRFKMWRRGGTTILRIDNVRVADSGEFKCIASNAYHDATVGKSASLKVYGSSETPTGFPRVTKYPEMVERPGRAYLTCDIVSDWPFNITWYKNSYPVGQSPRVFQEMGRLHFRNLTAEDDGNYECSVTNKFGTTFSRVSEVFVKSARNVNAPKPQVKEVRVAPGSNVNLTCVGVGTPAPRVKWQYKGQDLETGGSSVLQLIDIHQSRNYTCIAIGFGGRTFATFAIIVERNTASAKVKPVIIADATQIAVNYGEDANLTCATRGQSVLYFKWLLNGELIFQDNIGENINVSVLHVPRVTHSRNYTCVAVGAGVTTEAIFQIIALNADGPTITNPPKDQKVKEGKAVRFFCQASGVEPVRVTWQTGEQTNLPRSQHMSLDADGKNMHQLLIPSVSPKNSGTVYCVATDADGKTTTSEAKLDVYSYSDVPRGYPKFSKHPVTKSAELGTTVDFKCDSDGHPAPTITWYKDNFPVDQTEDRRIIMYKGRLIIDDLRSTDSGSYQCAAVNAFGTTYSKTSVLTLTARRFPPEFTSLSDPVTVARGASVNLTCTADGFPLPFVKWVMNGIDIDKHNIPTGGNVLLIRNVQSSGNYTCVAYNSLGVIRTDFQVKMRSPPKLVNLPNLKPHVKKIPVAPGAYVNLTCIGTGASNPVYTWKSNGVDLINQHNAMLALKDVQETKNYTCVALGSKGTSEATFEVIVEDRDGPQITKPPLDKKVEEGSLVRFHCQVTGNPEPIIFWELNGRRVDERIHNRYTVSVRSGESVLDIDPARRRRDAGVITCVADNSKGQYSRNSAHLQIYDGTSEYPRTVFGQDSLAKSEIVSRTGVYEQFFDVSMPKITHIHTHSVHVVEILL
ncbi:hemicentin-1-like [Gigantopelta aegis]|uniref:hemicentin-1-like n=1 Tax=Gigantopelta aegis TaxID=1735272 RepID=UPI001B8875D5|nr:hemicentin-1-like [Gigantopelta aegis]